LRPNSTIIKKRANFAGSTLINIKQAMYYNGTMRRLHATTVAAE